ncbi:MAG TPA: right-handed parallel beta-helix repeat-containing protein, partial [Mucilaginibacter sp.]|nr:right-handed parallel beta-helix repeat-containing protein [Mucilaginibacter sp.]
VTNSTIKNVGYLGFYFDAETGGTTGGVFSNNLVDMSMIAPANALESGVAIRGSTSSGVITSNWTITGNTIKLCSRPANWSAECIEVRFMTNSVISNNTFIAGSIGCSVVRSSGITVSTNKFSGSDDEALEFADCQASSTKNNIITSAFNIGILIDGAIGSTGITLNGDVVSGTGSDCIEAYKNTQNLIVNACTLTAAAGGKAINLMHSSGIKIQNTIFKGNSVATMAVMLDTCPGNVSLTGGSVSNFKTCVITIYSAQSGLVTNNVTMTGVTVTGVPYALSKVVENGASVGSNIAVSL